MRLTSQQIYEKLINEDGILSLRGQIRFYLGDVDIIVKQRDVVGNIIQEWLQGWLTNREIEFAPSENTQMPPDFFLNPNNKTVDLLEVKAFYMKNGPGFDIADFNMYQKEIIAKPYMLNVDYLIFGYDMSSDGYVTVKNLWLKKVWEITRRMEKNSWALNLQIKKDVVHKIRPGNWYNITARSIPMFKSLEHYLSAIEQTVWQDPDTRNQSSTWKSRFEEAYVRFYGASISIPRWDDIKAEYAT